jgi:hypothetical protein
MSSGRNVSMCPHRSFLEHMNNPFCSALERRAHAVGGPHAQFCHSKLQFFS